MQVFKVLSFPEIKNRSENSEISEKKIWKNKNLETIFFLRQKIILQMYILYEKVKKINDNKCLFPADETVVVVVDRL